MPQKLVTLNYSEQEFWGTLEELLRKIVHSELHTHFGNLPKEDSALIGAKECCATLHCSRPTLTKYRRNGIITGYKVANTKKIMYRKNEVMKVFKAMPTIKGSRGNTVS